MSSTRYQQGTVSRVKRAKGPDVWVFRYRERNEHGIQVARKRVIGDLSRYPTKVSATRAVENTRAEINAGEGRLKRPTAQELWGHFQAHELRDLDVDRSPTTIEMYEINFAAYIIPHWGQYSIDDVKAPGVERWLRSLQKAPGTKAKLRNQMSALFNHAIRHGIWDKANPIASVRQSSKRQAAPELLTIREMQMILAELKEQTPLCAALLIAACTGLRRSEINGLKWEDVDWETGYLRPKRGWVRGAQTKMKTESSQKPVPVLPELLDVLRQWQDRTPYPNGYDWVFASEQTGGRTPLWLGVSLYRHIQPAARRAGVQVKVGWHTYRHSLASLLAAKGEHVKVVQELLRHANSNITLQLYQQADADQKRAAQRHTRELFLVA